MKLYPNIAAGPVESIADHILHTLIKV